MHGEKHSGCEISERRRRQKKRVLWISSSADISYIHPPKALLRGSVCQWWYSVMFLTSFMVKDFCSSYCGSSQNQRNLYYSSIYIHIFNCVESTCLLRLNNVPSLQKQVYARLTPRTREKEESFSIWACKISKSFAVHQARIQSLCWYFCLVYLRWWLCLCKCSKTAILPTKTLNQTNILDARLAFPSLGCRMTSCLALMSVCIANMEMEVVQTAMFTRLCRMRFTRFGRT